MRGSSWEAAEIDHLQAPEQKSLTEAAGQSGCAGVKLRQQVALWLNGRGRGMKVVERYGRVRYAVQIEGLSRREAARQFGIDPPLEDPLRGMPLLPGPAPILRQDTVAAARSW